MVWRILCNFRINFSQRKNKTYSKFFFLQLNKILAAFVHLNEISSSFLQQGEPAFEISNQLLWIKKKGCKLTVFGNILFSDNRTKSIHLSLWINIIREKCFLVSVFVHEHLRICNIWTLLKKFFISWKTTKQNFLILFLSWVAFST